MDEGGAALGEEKQQQQKHLSPGEARARAMWMVECVTDDSEGLFLEEIPKKEIASVHGNQK